MPRKSSFCMGPIFASAFFRPSRSSARIISLTASILSPPKNMCSVLQRPMPSAPNPRATFESSGVSALVRTPSFLYLSVHAISFSKRRYISESSGFRVLSISTWLISEGTVSISPAMTSPVVPSIGNPVSFLESLVSNGDGPGLVVYLQGSASRDAGLAHASSDDGRMGGHATECGKDSLRRGHALNIFRRGLLSDEHARPRFRHLDRLVGSESDLACRRSRAGVSSPWRGACHQLSPFSFSSDLKILARS